MAREIQYRNSDWLKGVLHRDRYDKTVQDAIRTIRKKAPKFDTIAFRGMSGALIAPILAHKLRKTLIMVRKGWGEGHSYYLVEGEYTARTYLIVDDFIGTGQTVQTIIERVREFTNDNMLGPAKCVGAYMTYHSMFYRPNQLMERARCPKDWTGNVKEFFHD